jgi:hypothetical protein
LSGTKTQKPGLDKACTGRDEVHGGDGLVDVHDVPMGRDEGGEVRHGDLLEIENARTPDAEDLGEEAVMSRSRGRVEDN